MEEMDLTYNEERFLFYIETNFELEPQRTTKERKTKNMVEEKDKDVEIVGKTWKGYFEIAYSTHFNQLIFFY
jgi:hypothetical protein